MIYFCSPAPPPSALGFLQRVHSFRWTNGFPRHVFITSAYISFVIKPCSFLIIEPSEKVYVCRIIYGLIFCLASE